MAVFDRRVESAADARSWLTSFLHERDVEQPTVMDASLVVSELVTNALRHGEGPTVLRGLADGDGGAGVGHRFGRRRAPRCSRRTPSASAGSGLVVVSQVAAAWGVAPFPGGKTVWAVLARPGSG